MADPRSVCTWRVRCQSPWVQNTLTLLLCQILGKPSLADPRSVCTWRVRCQSLWVQNALTILLCLSDFRERSLAIPRSVLTWRVCCQSLWVQNALTLLLYQILGKRPLANLRSVLMRSVRCQSPWVQNALTLLRCLSDVRVCLLVACLTSQQHSSVSQGRICSDSCTCCHTETEPSHSMLTPGRPVSALTL